MKSNRRGSAGLHKGWAGDAGEAFYVHGYSHASWYNLYPLELWTYLLIVSGDFIDIPPRPFERIYETGAQKSRNPNRGT